MDGFQTKLRQSLQYKLSAWLTLVILGMALAAGAFSFAAAFQEAIELQDDQLRQITLLADQKNWQIASPESATGAGELDQESRVILQWLPKTAPTTPLTSVGYLNLPADLPDGVQTVTVHDESWRLIVRTLGSGERIVAGQQTAIRNEIAQDGALRTLFPFLILIPVLLVMVSVLIRQMFKPVKQLSTELDQRAQEDLRAISGANVPSEIQPFVEAINSLLFRVTQTMAAQRRFLADAAHELRSPLTALSLQSERLGAAEMSPEAKVRLSVLQSGLQRSRQLLDQLLALARAQETPKADVHPVSVRQVCRDVLEDLMPQAMSKNIDIGIVGEENPQLLVPEMDLRTLIKNLLDNAIRYSPVGGQIDIHISNQEGFPTLRVDDLGPGIPATERARVFDPFYRILGNDEIGSGLGLSIVKTITDRMGASIVLKYTDEQQQIGLSVAVVFPSSNPDHPTHG